MVEVEAVLTLVVVLVAAVLGVDATAGAWLLLVGTSAIDTNVGQAEDLSRMKQ